MTTPTTLHRGGFLERDYSEQDLGDSTSTHSSESSRKGRISEDLPDFDFNDDLTADIDFGDTEEDLNFIAPATGSTPQTEGFEEKDFTRTEIEGEPESDKEDTDPNLDTASHDRVLLTSLDEGEDLSPEDYREANFVEPDEDPELPEFTFGPETSESSPVEGLSFGDLEEPSSLNEVEIHEETEKLPEEETGQVEETPDRNSENINLVRITPDDINTSSDQDKEHHDTPDHIVRSTLGLETDEEKAESILSSVARTSDNVENIRDNVAGNRQAFHSLETGLSGVSTTLDDMHKEMVDHSVSIGSISKNVGTILKSFADNEKKYAEQSSLFTKSQDEFKESSSRTEQVVGESAKLFIEGLGGISNSLSQQSEQMSGTLEQHRQALEAMLQASEEAQSKNSDQMAEKLEQSSADHGYKLSTIETAVSDLPDTLSERLGYKLRGNLDEVKDELSENNKKLTGFFAEGINKSTNFTASKIETTHDAINQASAEIAKMIAKFEDLGNSIDVYASDSRRDQTEILKSVSEGVKKSLSSLETQVVKGQVSLKNNVSTIHEDINSNVSNIARKQETADTKLSNISDEVQSMNILLTQSRKSLNQDNIVIAQALAKLLDYVARVDSRINELAGKITGMNATSLSSGSADPVTVQSLYSKYGSSANTENSESGKHRL